MSTDPDQPSKPRKRWIWAVILFVLMSVALVATWRATSLSGLPDIGDPFDVAAFADVKIPEDQNAFTFYKRAVASLTADKAGYTNDWATASEAERAWLNANQAALEVWKQGTDRTESYYINPRTSTFAAKMEVATGLRICSRMMKLEASRRMANGDQAGAYAMYRAGLRSSRHLGRRGSLLERLIGSAIHRVTATEIIKWAGKPEVDAPLLRKALDDAIAIDAMTPPDSDAIKVEYLLFLNSITDPAVMMAAADVNAAKGPRANASIQSMSLLLKSEPERSRRVLKLVTANWLAYCDLPRSRQPPSVASMLALAKTDPSKPLLDQIYVTDPSCPAMARVMPPDELAEWWKSTFYVRMSLPTLNAVKAAIDRERATQANLVVTLANELHKRDHGKFPDSTEELVGPYLKALPEGYSRPPG